MCGGTVLRCLTEKRDSIKAEVCQKEVFYFQKMEVQDYRNDVILAATCRLDVDKFCANTQPGEGAVAPSPVEGLYVALCCMGRCSTAWHGQRLAC